MNYNGYKFFFECDKIPEPEEEPEPIPEPEPTPEPEPQPEPTPEPEPIPDNNDNDFNDDPIDYPPEDNFDDIPINYDPNDEYIDEPINIPEDKYHAAFWYEYDAEEPENIPGFGVNRPWVPPLKQPDSLITLFDRYMLVGFTTNPLLEAVIAYLYGFGTKDSWDGYFYSNA